ncbi:zinc-binding alcohol dehydrogenase family protein [Photobacterium galatheae]|uniref:Zinc-type alcohol dehydrogenase-like protein n=2 Tax=Photobacterium galatheae TaxID=1654360 RepID=A0A066RW58_9GAMM|nr:zinc-binding alcohol dehydrogenase family protein [Photobacterium galatheae]KDM93341.1 NADPH:quinone reductase [Photobacterium galatheae]MCM0150463.1 zinc-binding alcohol dehydrogenase family protein [Photobacterium galatheae]
MKAVALTHYLPISNPDSLMDIELPAPAVSGHDILVRIEAISVNPVDVKVRAPKDKTEPRPRVLGWDAAGTVVAVGEDVTQFQTGDEVYYAGDITRPGTNSEYHVVDARIVGKKPQSLSMAEAAALPLTGITAWEALFERLGIPADGFQSPKSILIIGGAGGVGSVAIQLASQIARLQVIATASREETKHWCLELGADLTINHRLNLAEQLAAQGYPTVDYILCLNDTAGHWAAMTHIIKPQGMICSIVESPEPLDMEPLKSKSAGFVWEFMFTRSMYQTEDMAEQGKLLNQISQLVEHDTLQTTMRKHLTPINADNLRKAHALVEQGNMIGKVVLSGW